MRSLALLALALTGALGLSSARARQTDGVRPGEGDGFCFDFSSKDVGPGAPRFSDYRVAPRSLKPAPAKITPEFRIFRTMIRRGAAEGPNFAGRYAFAWWGMAIGHRCWVIVDGVTGKISADITPSLGEPYFTGTPINCVTVLQGDGQEPRYRPDSRLLILTGRIGGETGVAYYVWTGSTLKRLRFYPADELCRGRAGAGAG